MLLALPTAFAPVPARALSFQFDFGTNVPDGFQTATREAADVWSSLLEDDVTVDLRIEYTDLSEAGGVLGGIQPGKVKVKYEDYVDALFKDAVSANDFSGINSLPLSSKGREALQDFQTGEIDFDEVKLESKEFAFLMDGQFAQGKGKQGTRPDFLDNNGNNNNKNVQLTRAQAKALGLLDANKSGLDGLIKINSNVNWDLDRSDGIERDRHDLASVIQHEIGHALGFVSGVDALDFLASASEPTDIEENSFSYLTPLDFYRYSEESADLGVLDATIGGSEKYFSLDGGRSAVTDDAGRAAYFSTGSFESGGDGYQGSHWKAGGTPLGVMNPNLQTGQSIDISQLDLALLDAIGWDIEDPNAERAAAVGFDWASFESDLERDRQDLTDALSIQWSDDIPEFDAALGDAASEADFKFRQKIQEKFDGLVEKLAKETKQKKRNEALAKFYKEVDKETEKRNKSIGELPKKIVKLDEEVREWIDLPVDKLAKEMREADRTTINRFSNVVKALPEDQQEAAEEKIEEAVAQFADEPSKLVEDLLDTSGPANPVGWNYLRWWWWWQEDDDYSGEDSDDLLENIYYSKAASGLVASGTGGSFSGLSPIDSSHLSLTAFANADSEVRDIPEPSSVLALFGITAMGAILIRRKS